MLLCISSEINKSERSCQQEWFESISLLLVIVKKIKDSILNKSIVTESDVYYCTLKSQHFMISNRTNKSHVSHTCIHISDIQTTYKQNKTHVSHTCIHMSDIQSTYKQIPPHRINIFLYRSQNTYLIVPLVPSSINRSA